MKRFFGGNNELVESLEEQVRSKDIQNDRLRKSLENELKFKEILFKKVKTLIKLNYFAECISNMFDLNSISTDTELINCLDKILEYDKTTLKATRKELTEELKNAKKEIDNKNLEIRLYKNSKEKLPNTGALLDKIKEQGNEIITLKDNAAYLKSENSNLLKFIDKMDKNKKEQSGPKKELAANLQLGILKTAIDDFKSIFDKFSNNANEVDETENLKIVNESSLINNEKTQKSRLTEVSLDKNSVLYEEMDKNSVSSEENIIDKIQQVLNYKNINILDVDMDEKLIETDNEDIKYITYADENTELNELSTRLKKLETNSENSELRSCLHLFVKNRKVYEIVAKVYQHWTFYRTAPYKLMNPFATSFLNIEELTDENAWDISRYGTEKIAK